MPEPLVILGSARSDGETRQAVDHAFPTGAKTIVLPEHHIGGYDYRHGNENDAFAGVIDAMLCTEAIVFATPVYWYAMSAPLKIFFDRLSDLLEIAKDKGRALAGKSVWLIATGTEIGLPEGFEVPFRRTAGYFAMHYRGAGYLYTGEDAVLREKSAAALSAFGEHVLKMDPLVP